MGYPHLGFDPAPGDLGAANHLLHRLRRATEAITRAQSTLGGLDGDPQRWQGRAATAYSTVNAQLDARVHSVAQNVDAATAAVQEWTHDLGDLQLRAAALEEEARVAAGAVAAAEADPRLGLTVSGDDPHSAAVKGEAVRRLDDAHAALDAVRARARDLLGEHGLAAEDAADAVRGAFPDSGGNSFGLIGRVVDFVDTALDKLTGVSPVGVLEGHKYRIGAFGDALSDISTAVSTVGSVTARLPGLQLPGIAIGLVGNEASRHALMAHSVARALGNEEVTGGDLAMDGLGMVPALSVVKPLSYIDSAWNFGGAVLEGDISPDTARLLWHGLRPNHPDSLEHVADWVADRYTGRFADAALRDRIATGG